jgi:CheY-like chemotaxis protein
VPENGNVEGFDIIHLYASIAHEVNNPLTIIDGYAEIIQSMLAQPATDRAMVDKYFAKMRATIRRVSKIVNGLKEMALSSEGVPTQSLDLVNIINDAINLCEERINASKMSVNSIFGKKIPVLGWSWQLTQVFCNVINNACDALGPDSRGNLTISLVPDSDSHVISIEDTGNGIPEAIRNRIFYPFYTTKAEGTGMGLALSKQFMKNHGGDIRLDANAKGGRFLISLPRKAKNRPEGELNTDPTDFLSPRINAAVPSVAARPSSAMSETPRERLDVKILIVDDEEEIVDILRFYLSHFFEHVTTTPSSLQAAQMLKDEYFDILITDIVMPEMSGFELIKAAKANGFAGHVVVISGSSSQMPEEAIAGGVDSVFNKPIDFQSLASRLQFLFKPVSVINSRRQFERMEVDTRIRIRLFSGDREFMGKAEDFSRDGFCFSGNAPGLKIGTEVFVRIFYLNNNINRSFDANAIVRWMADGSVGCQLKKTEDKASGALDDLLNFIKTNSMQKLDP